MVPMQIALKLLLGFLALGSAMGAIDAESTDERLLDLGISISAAIVSAVWFFLARRGSANREKFDRVVGLKGIDWRAAGVFLGLTVGVPAGIHVLVERTVHIETPLQQLLVGTLAVAGDPAAAEKARGTLREMFCQIDLSPDENGELWAEYALQPAALIQAVSNRHSTGPLRAL
jgi:hypothetical protein